MLAQSEQNMLGQALLGRALQRMPHGSVAEANMNRCGFSNDGSIALHGEGGRLQDWLERCLALSTLCPRRNAGELALAICTRFDALLVEKGIKPIVIFFRPGPGGDDDLAGANMDTLNQLTAEQFSLPMAKFLAAVGQGDAHE